MAPTSGSTFDDVVLPHLAAARRLARWLLQNEQDAEDVVQEASLRALRYFGTFAGGNGRAWFLRIVRNSCRDWQAGPLRASTEPFEESEHYDTARTPDPEALLLRTDGVALVTQTIRDMPDRSRELLVRRELEGLSYQELADVMGVPIGTVMSGLSRARRALRGALDRQLEAPHRRVRALQAAKGPPERTSPRSLPEE